MPATDALKAVTKPYERKARLYPVFLCLLPLVGVAVGVYGIKLEGREVLASMAISVGIFFLLANISRESGKRLEPQLYRQWGGTPTTQVQRHRDKRIDRVTKAGHHSFLATKIGVGYPLEGDEISNPTGADEVYAAGTRWLIGATRDIARFDLLFAENIEYGYRRNAYGLRWIGVLLCAAAIIWCLVAEGALSSSGLNVPEMTKLSSGATCSLLLSAVMLIVWLFFFTAASVKSAAFAYADALFGACLALRQGRGEE